MQTQTLPEQIANRLRRAILSGALQPGDTVKERDNATELGVSRTPMREAIRILAKEGLVVLRPARSPVVANPTLKDVTDDLTVIRSLESLCGELACAHAKPRDLARIRALHETMLDITDTADPLDFFETDMAFHRAIAAASHNPSLAATHGQYLARLWRVRFLSARKQSQRDRVLRQHGLIVEGLESRDAGLVARELSSHVRHINNNITGYFSDGESGY